MPLRVGLQKRLFVLYADLPVNLVHNTLPGLPCPFNSLNLTVIKIESSELISQMATESFYYLCDLGLCHRVLWLDVRSNATKRISIKSSMQLLHVWPNVWPNAFETVWSNDVCGCILRALLKRLVQTLKRLVQTRLDQTFVQCPIGLRFCIIC